jgi:nucleoside-diphosphate-sugar epimerase
MAVTGMTVNLVLGGSGFIGRHVGLAFARRGQRVRLAGRAPASPINDRLSDCLTYEKLDMRTANWDRVLDGVDVVHHYAWSSIPETSNINPVVPGRLYDVPVSVLSVARAERELRWSPQLSFLEGLQLALDDYGRGERSFSTLQGATPLNRRGSAGRVGE